MHFFGQICTSRSDFPRSRFLKVQICPNQCTHPTHAPHAPHPRPVLRCPTVQKTGRFTSPSPVSAGYSPPIPKSAGFLYPPHQKQAPTGRNAPAIQWAAADRPQPQHAPHTPTTAGAPHKPFSVQKPGRFASQPPVSPARATQNPNLPVFCTLPTK